MNQWPAENKQHIILYINCLLLIRKNNVKGARLLFAYVEAMTASSGFKKPGPPGCNTSRVSSSDNITTL
jgi:hypothetical protein